MVVGIVGLGLMGGSAARQYAHSGAKVYAYNRTKSKVDTAIREHVVDEYLSDENIQKCDLIILSAPLESSIDFLSTKAHLFKNYVIDFCGIKQKICSIGVSLSSKFGFAFIGTHPMCGTNRSGYENSLDNLYDNSTIVLAIDDDDKNGKDNSDNPKFKGLFELLKPLNFGKFVYCTPALHDKIIAYTSQMAHCITTSFVKSPTCENTLGITGGGFRDMTRLASLIPSMWSELFISNKENLVSELDTFITNITLLRNALAKEDKDEVFNLLSQGRDIKDKMEKSWIKN